MEVELVCHGKLKEAHTPFIMHKIQGPWTSGAGFTIDYECGVCKNVVHVEIKFH